MSLFVIFLAALWLAFSAALTITAATELDWLARKQDAEEEADA